MTTRARTRRPSKRLRTLSGNRRAKIAPSRRLSAAERKAFLARVGEALPLLEAPGRIVVARAGDDRSAGLWRDGVFIAGYTWQRGAIGEAVVVLPPGSEVRVVDVQGERA